MQPNPYLLEKLAALRESELQQRNRFAHLRLPAPAHRVYHLIKQQGAP